MLHRLNIDTFRAWLFDHKLYPEVTLPAGCNFWGSAIIVLEAIMRNRSVFSRFISGRCSPVPSTSKGFVKIALFVCVSSTTYTVMILVLFGANPSAENLMLNSRFTWKLLIWKFRPNLFVAPLPTAGVEMLSADIIDNVVLMGAKVFVC